ncbi:MAG: V-type ATP synthase subunit K [Exilispira sp.]|jgi:V/A-type H+-transporting ATPase subunit K|nr:V-type ATP synthase subunit K [Exilispira sp.]
MGFTLAIVGAAIAAILSGIGSAIGIMIAGRAAAGSLSEDPTKFGKFLPLVALPGTQGIYGFIISFLIFLKLGIIGGTPNETISVSRGLQYIFAAMPIAFAGLFSAIYQGKVCASGINLVSKQPTETGKALTMGGLVEFYAILGLLISIFFVLFITP